MSIEDALNAPSHVYFVYSEGRVKIGFSKDWLRRVEQVCKGCPGPAETILVFPGGPEQERGWHELFSAYRESGEWFRCEGKVREFLSMYAGQEGREALELAEEGFRERLAA